jgi:hypothetical protein
VSGFTYLDNTLTIERSSGNPNLFVTINDFTGLTINGDLNVTGNTIVDGITANTISASTYLNLPIDVFVTGGTYDNVSGTATFTNNTGGTFNISGLFTGATDVYVTGGTYSDNTFTFTNVTGGTFSVSFNSVSGLTINGDLNVTGNTIVDGVTANTISATTYQNLPIDVFVTGGTFSGGVITLINNTGGTFSISGISSFDTFVTGGTYSAGTATFTNNSGGTFDVSGFSKYFLSTTEPTGTTINLGDRWFNLTDGVELVYVDTGSGLIWVEPNPGGNFLSNYLPLSGGTVSGATNFLNGIYTDTISATTYQNLPPRYGSFGLTIDGGGSDILTGNKGYLTIPYAGTITGWQLISNTSGSCVIDVWKTSAGNIPTVADTITGTEKPTLSSQQINSDLNLSTWTTSVSQYDVFAFNVDSTSGLTRVNLSIYITKQ